MGEPPHDTDGRPPRTDAGDAEDSAESPRGPDPGPSTARDDATTDSSRSADGRMLELTVVEYEGRSDRATVHPSGLTGIERMETWLSADASAFVDLSSWR